MLVKTHLQNIINFHFEARNEDGNLVNIDASPEMGGEGKGSRPMQLVLMGLGGCSAIDIVNILKKQKQVIDDFQIFVEGEREEGKVPSVFTEIKLIFSLKGKLDKEKVKRAVSLSVEKYCSVKAILDKTAEIKYSIELNGNKI